MNVNFSSLEYLWSSISSDVLLSAAAAVAVVAIAQTDKRNTIHSLRT